MLTRMVFDVWALHTFNWKALPFIGAFVVILIVWNEEKVKVNDFELGAFSLSIECVSVGVALGFMGLMRRMSLRDFGLSWMTLR